MLKKFLVIQTASIGDAILATPVLEKLHHFYPDAEIDILVKKGNQDLFTNHPFIHEVIIWNKKSRKKRNFLWTLYDIRKNHYDAVINIQRFLSSGILTAYSGAKFRIGFKKNPLSWLFTSSIPHQIQNGIHEVDRNLRLIEKLTDQSRFRPVLYPSKHDFKKVSCYKNQDYITISPGSIWFTKKFPLQKWIDFVRSVPANTNILFLGSKEDHEMCDKIIMNSGHKNSINLSGHLTFLESAALIKDAKMNFTNDSSPMHLASSVNAPVTAVYCSTVPDFGFGPLSDQSFVVEIRKKLSCRPCGLHGLRSCPKGHFKCANDIEVGQLMENI